MELGEGMVAVVLPIGQYAGEFYAQAGDANPEYYEVRLGNSMARLDPDSFDLWALAHGNPQDLDEGAELNRLSLAAAANESGIADAGPQIADLQRLGLLAQVLPTENQLHRFARDYCARSLAVGLGTTSEDPSQPLIGYPDTPLISVPESTYNVWLYSDRHGSIWETCQYLAPRLSSVEAAISPEGLISEFFDILPLMVAVGCVYLDLRSGNGDVGSS